MNHSTRGKTRRPLARSRSPRPNQTCRRAARPRTHREPVGLTRRANRPPNCTALGKVLLAFLPSEQREEILPMLTFERATPHTIPNLARFRKELARVVQQSLAMDDQETDLGARCVAAPVLDESGKVAAAISVSGPITRMSRDRIQAFALATKKAARTISARLRHSN